jgi:hypothetical protein
MSDHSALSVDTAWLTNLVGELIDHLTRHLNPLLPESRSLVATADQVILTDNTVGYPKTISSHHVHVPPRLDPSDFGPFARSLMSDIQDLIIMNMHGPWPLTNEGRSTHARASSDGQIIELGFRVAGESEDSITLPPFTIGPRPERVVSAG